MCIEKPEIVKRGHCYHALAPIGVAPTSARGILGLNKAREEMILGGGMSRHPPPSAFLGFGKPF
jgi:hypothetical protein